MRGGRRNLFGDWRREREREGNCFITRSVTGNDGKAVIYAKCKAAVIANCVQVFHREVITWHVGTEGCPHKENIWWSWFPIMPRCGPGSCPCIWGLFTRKTEGKMVLMNHMLRQFSNAGFSFHTPLTSFLSKIWFMGMIFTRAPLLWRTLLSIFSNFQ